MEENAIFNSATNITRTINANCKTIEEVRELLKLIDKLLEAKRSISPLPSSV